MQPTNVGIRVPDEVAVVAFDGTQESEYCWPPLTSARQPVKEMAEAAVQHRARHHPSPVTSGVPDGSADPPLLRLPPPGPYIDQKGTKEIVIEPVNACLLLHTEGVGLVLDVDGRRTAGRCSLGRRYR